MMMTCQCRFINSNKCPTGGDVDIDVVGGGGRVGAVPVGAAGMWEMSVPFSIFLWT